jgi:hypothetical protein
MLKIKSITSKIVHVQASTQKELNEAFLRLTEYGESPEWKGKIFTLGQYRKWYAETNGAFSYDTDWAGFNLNQDNFKPFVRGLFDPLTENEQQLVDWVKDRDDVYSVIGSQPDGDAFEHEVCHALFATDIEYKEQCTKVIVDMAQSHPDQYAKMAKWIIDVGYHESVTIDEMHAFISADRDWLMEKKGIYIDPSIQTLLVDIKKKFYTPKK